jgi:hypothetical protein
VLLVVIVACVDQPAPSDSQPFGSVAPLPLGTLTTGLDGRGSESFDGPALLQRHEPAEGEECIPSRGKLFTGVLYGAGVPLPPACQHE